MKNFTARCNFKKFPAERPPSKPTRTPPFSKPRPDPEKDPAPPDPQTPPKPGLAQVRVLAQETPRPDPPAGL